MTHKPSQQWVVAGAVAIAVAGVAFWWWWTTAPTTTPSIAVNSTSTTRAQSNQRELSVESVPSGASLHIQGVYVGRTPARAFPVQLEDGEAALSLVLRREGFAPHKQTITWPQGQRSIELRVVLEAK